MILNRLWFFITCSFQLSRCQRNWKQKIPFTGSKHKYRETGRSFRRPKNTRIARFRIRFRVRRWKNFLGREKSIHWGNQKVADRANRTVEQPISTGTGGVVITPGCGVAITPSTLKILCGNDCYETKHSKIFQMFRILQKVILVKMTFITPSTWNSSGIEFYNTKHSKILAITPSSPWRYYQPLYKNIWQILQNGGGCAINAYFVSILRRRRVTPL